MAIIKGQQSPSGGSSLNTARIQTLIDTSIDASFDSLPIYANNAAAIVGGLVAGDLYRTGADPDFICVVH